jgi:uncharacterized membrane protein
MIKNEMNLTVLQKYLFRQLEVISGVHLNFISPQSWH